MRRSMSMQSTASRHGMLTWRTLVLWKTGVKVCPTTAAIQITSSVQFLPQTRMGGNSEWLHPLMAAIDGNEPPLSKRATVLEFLDTG